jgi:hypothetical protein
MDSNPLQRRLTFALIVVVLAGLGAYLLGSVARGSSRPPAPKASTAAPAPAAPAPAAPSPAAAALGSTSGSTPDIYQWLPFTQAGLAAAADLAVRFGDGYGTFSYTQSAGAYLARLAPLTSAQLASQIKAAYSVPGVVTARSTARQVSAGTAVIESIRAFGPSSITFVVQITENLTAVSGRSQLVTSYAITETGSGSNWQVTDIELASAGNS